MRCSAVFACVRVLAETGAQLPLVLFRRVTDDRRERATDQRAYKLVHDQPNPDTTPYVFWETLIAHLVLRGNAYAVVERDRLRRPKWLWQIPEPDRMVVERDKTTNLLKYTYRQPMSGDLPLDPRDVLHLRGLSGDGIKGYSILELARESIGLSVAAEGYGARFFRDDARPGGVLSHPGRLGPDGADNLRESWKKAHQGRGHNVAVLEEGMTWTSVGISPEDAQFLETRQFQVTDIARIFGVPPHLAGDLVRATFSNITEQDREFVRYKVMPLLIRVAQQCNAVLLTESEREQYYFEHIVDALMRGSQAERYAGYAVGRQWGWLSVNDIRRLENMMPLPGKQGDQYMVPVNMQPASLVASLPSGGADNGGNESS